MRSWQIWFGAFVLSTILIGVYFDRDRTPSKKRNVMKNKTTVWQCEACESIYADPHPLCPICHGDLTYLEFRSMSMLQAHILRMEQDRERRTLQHRFPGCEITSMDAMYFLTFEQRNHCRLYATTQDDEQTSGPMILSCKGIDSNRLAFARFLVSTGRLSEEVEP
jgi:hypothetical protein